MRLHKDVTTILINVIIRFILKQYLNSYNSSNLQYLQLVLIVKYSTNQAFWGHSQTACVSYTADHLQPTCDKMVRKHCNGDC